MEFCVDGIEGPTVGRERGNVAFNAPNIVDVMPDFGIVAATPPFARNSGQFFEDHESMLRILDIDEAGFTKGRRVKNLLLKSQDFSDSGVWNQNTGASTIANDALAPDGSLTADRITTSATAGQRVQQNNLIAKSGGSVVMSVSIKTFDVSSIRLLLRNNTTATNVIVLNLTPTTDWERLSGTYTGNNISAGDSLSFYLYVDETANDSSGAYLWAWGAQLEEVSGQSQQAASKYIPTTTAAVSKFYNTTNGNTVLNNVVIENEGTLLTGITGRLSEEGSTNQCLQSSDITLSWTIPNITVVSNDVAGPTGAVVMDFMNQTTANANHFMYSANYVRPATVQTWTASIYVKAKGHNYLVFQVTNSNGSKYGLVQVDLSTGVISNIIGGTWTAPKAKIESLPNGIYRIQVTATTDGVADGLRLQLFHSNSSWNKVFVGVVGNGINVWGGQLEEKPEATSLIETTTAAVSRSSTHLEYDSLNLKANDISGYVEFTAGAVSGRSVNAILGLFESGTDLFHVRYSDNFTQMMITKISSGVTSTATFSPLVMVKGTTYKIAWRLSSILGVDVWVDGVKGTNNNNTDDITTVPAAFESGSYGNGTLNANGDTNNERFWKEAMSDDFLKALTS